MAKRFICFCFAVLNGISCYTLHSDHPWIAALLGFLGVVYLATAVVTADD